MKKYKRREEKEFTALKSMLDNGVPLSQLSKVTGRSIFTLDYVRKSDSIDDYKNKMRQHNAKYVQNGVSKNEESKQPMVYLDMRSDVVKLLESIDKRLERLEARKGFTF